MSTATPTEPKQTLAESNWIPSPLYRMPLEQYEAMVTSGIFTSKDRFHLIDGLLVGKMTKNPPHSAACEAVRAAIERLLPAGWHVRSEQPLRMPSHASEPEPDLAVARGGWRDYATRHPEPADIALVVEVADSSLALDRKLGRIYSAAGIPVYWIMNLVDRLLEVHSEPGPTGYRSERVFKIGDQVPLEIDGREVARIAVMDVLPWIGGSRFFMSATMLTEPPRVEALDGLPGPLYRMPLEKYEAMVASGILGPGDRVHLIQGYLVDKMTQNDAHATADELCGKLLDRAIPAGWHVRSAKPIRLASQASKPEPDRCVVRREIRDYRHRSPQSEDLALVVEVADSSLALDRKLGRMYAAAGIPVYWILNLVERQLEVYNEPSPAGYKAERVFKAGDSAPLEIDAQEIGRIVVAEMLP